MTADSVPIITAGQGEIMMERLKSIGASAAFAFMVFYGNGTGAPVVDGNARFTVLTPTLIRMEFAGDTQFDDRATITAVNRTLPAASFTSTVIGGWREIQTSKLTLRYQQNSGAFSATNLEVRLTVAGQSDTVFPWSGVGNAAFDFNTVCEAEYADLSGGAAVATDHTGYSGQGFAAGITQAGAKISLNVSKAPAGNAVVTVRYANSTGGDGQNVTRTMTLTVNGVANVLSFPVTGNWNTWSTVQRTCSFAAGNNTIVLSFEPSNTGNINVDWIATSPVSAPVPTPSPTPPAVNTTLGGWTRGIDAKSGAMPLYDGFLSRNGWYLLDDSKTADLGVDNWPIPRPAHRGGYQDAYFFGYGHDYKTAFSDFYAVSGNPFLLPRYACGIWFSRYNAYYARSYQDTLIPTFRSETTPIDVLCIDTDWKQPSSWNGWNWSTQYFPAPVTFLTWAHQQGLKISLNIHPTIQGDDPKFAAANSIPGGLPSCGTNVYYWDWGVKAQAQSYFNLNAAFNDQGVDIWWLDWCCDGRNVAMAGLPGDAWVNNQYLQYHNGRGTRGFAFSRIGSGYAGYAAPGSPNSAWGEHRATLHFTGDADSTWNMLSFESYMTIREGNIGLPYVSHDIGSFHGNHLSDAMYLRWVQFGTFQPIFRLHSDHGDRLPWSYPAVRANAEKFMRLRHALIPYTYSLSYESSIGGFPMVRGMYLYYPENAEAYTYDRQYMFGDQLLVSPIVTGGTTASVSVWFPQGMWTNFFTGDTVRGPVVRTVTADFTAMPVFAKLGAVIPMQAYMDYVGQKKLDSLAFMVYPGADGAFTLYEDEGENLNYRSGSFVLTPLTYQENGKTFIIGAKTGTYTGAPAQRAYTVTFVNRGRPATVTINGTIVNEVAAGSAEGWWMSGVSLIVHADPRPVTSDVIIATAQATGITGQKQRDRRALPMFRFHQRAGNLTVVLSGDPSGGPYSIVIRNLSGRTLFEKKVDDASAAALAVNAVTGKGVFFITVKKGDLQVTKKFLIQ